MAPSKARVFISYSRKDKFFADRLDLALRERGYAVLIDRSEILAFEDWWKRIESMISSSDTVVFVLSPGSVASEVCKKEVAFAVSLNKRFAPIVCQRVELQAVPEVLRRLNFIDFDAAEEFQASSDALAEALNTNIDWIRKHTEFGEAARRWETAGRPKGMLLQSPLLEEAEHWISSRPESAPLPVGEVQAFVVQSRHAATRRRNTITGALAAGLLAALGLAAIAYWQRTVAISQRDDALLAQSRNLTGLAKQYTANSNFVTAALIALEALPDGSNRPARPYWPPAEAELYNAITRMREQSVFDSKVPDLLWSVFSSDGSNLITVEKNGTIQRLSLQRKHTETILKLDVDLTQDLVEIIPRPNISTALVWAKSVTHIVDLSKGKEVATLKDLPANTKPTDIDQTRTRLILQSDAFPSSSILWDVPHRRKIVDVVGPADHKSAKISGDGSLIITIAAEGPIEVLNAMDGRPIRVIQMPGEDVIDGVISRDGKQLALLTRDNRGSISGELVDIAAAQLTSVIRNLQCCGNIWIAPNGKVAAIYDGTRVQLLNFASSSKCEFDVPIEQFVGSNREASFSFSPDSERVLIGGADRTATVRDANCGIEFVLGGHTEAVKSAAFSPNGDRIVTTSLDTTLRVWNAKTDPSLVLGKELSHWLSNIAYDPVNERVAVSTGNSVDTSIFDINTSKLKSISGAGVPISFSADGTKLLTLRGNDSAEIWDVRDAERYAAFEVLPGKGWMSPDASNIVTVDTDKTASLWRSHPRARVATLSQNGENLDSVVFSPIDHVVVGVFKGGKVEAWDSQDGRSIGILISETRTVAPEYAWRSNTAGGIFSADGNLLLTWSGTKAHLWDMRTRHLLQTFEENKKDESVDIESAAFSPNGRVVATGSLDGKVRIWDAKNGSALAEMTVETDQRLREIVTDFMEYGMGHEIDPESFRRDGRRIVTSPKDETARIWDSQTGLEVGVLRSPGQAVRHAFYSHDNTRIITMTGGGQPQLRIWPAFQSLSELIGYVKAHLPRCLTQSERRELGLEPSHQAEIDADYCRR